MKPQRIILVMPVAPLPFGDAAGRWFYVLMKGLVERGHSVKAFAACPNASEAEAARDLFPGPAYALRCYEYAQRSGLRGRFDSFLRPHSYIFDANFHRDFDAAIRDPFDILHLEMQWSGWLGLANPNRALLTCHYLFQTDLEGFRPGASVDRIRHRRTIAAENRILRSYPLISALTPSLSATISRVNPRAELHTVPLALDLAQYPFDPGMPIKNPVVSLIGSFHWTPTRTAATRLLERLWPEIRKQVPGATLQLVGRQAMAACGVHHKGRGISIHEDVPDTIPYFRQASVILYAPERGSGMKVKVLEAFALGAAVVTNRDGVEGIPAVNGVHAGVCEDDDGLISRTVTLLQNGQARIDQCLAARKLVETHCAPEVVLDRLEAVYGRILATGKAG